MVTRDKRGGSRKKNWKIQAQNLGQGTYKKTGGKKKFASRSDLKECKSQLRWDRKKKKWVPQEGIQKRGDGLTP